MYQEDYTDGDDGAAATIDEQYFEGYGDLNVHHVMLSDVPRMAFYRQALSDRPSMQGRVVLDIGAGTGILSLWSALLGQAAHVIAFEASPLSTLLINIVEANSCSDRISVVGKRVEAVVARGVDSFLSDHPQVMLHGGIDVVVSEWMGFYLVHECMLPSVIAARDFAVEVNREVAARRGGDGTKVKSVRMLPDEATIYVAPINLTPLKQQYVDKWNTAAAGPAAPLSSPSSSPPTSNPLPDLSVMGTFEFESRLLTAVNPLVETLPPRCVLCPPQKVLSWDLNRVTVEECIGIGELRAACVFPPSQDEYSVHGFTIWFDVAACQRKWVLCTSPYSPPTHWKQCSILLPEEMGWQGDQVLVPAGSSMVAKIEVTCDDVTKRQYSLTLELDDA